MSTEKEKVYRAYGLLTALALELVALVVLGLFLGKWIDKNFNVLGLATPGLIFLAMGLWIYILIRALAKLDKEEKL